MTRIFAIAGLAVLISPAAFSLGIFERPAKLSGTVIQHPSPAQDFTLTDQNGLPFHMADTRGKVAPAVQVVWAGYGIGVTVDPNTEAVAVTEEKGAATGSSDLGERGLTKGLSDADLSLVGDIEQAFGGGYDVGHSAPFWFVDKHGIIREVMNGDATPRDMVKDIRALLASR